MSAWSYRNNNTAVSASEPEEELSVVLAGWFSVSGDVDDFIFYGDTTPLHSER